MTPTQPYDFAAAQEAARVASTTQRAAEQFVIDATRNWAEAERSYRKALATTILELRADGMAITACADVARGQPHVADLRYARDVAEGVREAASQAAWRASGDRKAQQTLVEWSMRVALRDEVQPDWSNAKTYGAQATHRDLEDN